ncbi:uncharacterized protein FIBRA_00105 [Fibroporia radiculosa]|uniref:N-acetyltransferase domain-containing protein n=1 Tax=Fibroporia radiculosa TaxID=599839 RepID=J7SBT6_9APHY|nr:uncharacterized protein FIBRA_00105 [Fibroporia radiculosa]CCL98111.1 predicted protein [Fibroporia radiculosa]
MTTVMDMYHPLQVNPITGEPFLRLPSPLDNIIITPPRLSDASSIVSILNDPRVCRSLTGPPYPYLLSHAEDWLKASMAESDALLCELAKAGQEKKESPPSIVGACPIRTLREVKNDGTEVFLGDICLRRCEFQFEEPDEERIRQSDENWRREPGNPELVYCVGDYIASSHHCRGIMSAALGILLSAWAIPRMGARKIRVEIFKGNDASVRVFEKNGFVIEKTVEKEVTTNFGDVKSGSHILWWRR